MKCIKCDNILRTGDKFCSKCGTASLESIPAPLPESERDYSGLERVVKDLIEEAATDHFIDEDTEHYVYEEAIMAIYGKNIFNWINKTVT